MSVRKAAEEHGVPRSTLHDRVTGKVAPNARSGAKRYLSDEEEAALVDFLIGCASVDCAKSCKDVMALIQQIVSARDSKVEVTRGWWDSFHARHPEVTLRHAEPSHMLELLPAASTSSTGALTCLRMSSRSMACQSAQARSLIEMKRACHCRIHHQK